MSRRRAKSWRRLPHLHEERAKQRAVGSPGAQRACDGGPPAARRAARELPPGRKAHAERSEARAPAQLQVPAARKPISSGLKQRAQAALQPW